MPEYQSPSISAERPLHAVAFNGSLEDGSSDADIKHGVEPVAYQAPEIGDAHDLTGGLIPISRPA